MKSFVKLKIYMVLFIQNSNISKGIKAINEQMNPSSIKEEILQFTVIPLKKEF